MSLCGRGNLGGGDWESWANHEDSVEDARCHAGVLGLSGQPQLLFVHTREAEGVALATGFLPPVWET